jgi:hypothetical protein
MPAWREVWGRAMQNELAHIVADSEAISWAFGCLVVALDERIRSMTILDSLPARLLMTGVIAIKVTDDLFATAITLAYKLGAIGVAQGLGKQTPGDDYARLIPLIQAVPWWLHGLWILASFLFLIAMIFVLVRRSSAVFLVLAATGVEIIAGRVGQPIIAATGVVVNPNPSVVAVVVIPYVVPLALAAVIWLAGRERSRIAHPN